MRENLIEKLKREEEELEKRMTSAPDDKDKTTESSAIEKTDGAEEAHVEGKEPVNSEPKPATDEHQESKREESEDWEKRYKNLRASRDENLYKAKRDIARLETVISNLQSEISKLRQTAPKVDPLEGVFTPEDTEALGEATIAAMRKATAKATEAATKPLQEQLERERKERERIQRERAEESTKEAYGAFIARIAKAVPDWEAINFDPRFISYMDEPDLDGIPRKTYFAAAEAQGNSATIIRYMNEWKASIKETPKKEDKLAKKVTPTGEDAGATQPKEPGQIKVISRQFIAKFYDDLARGRYKGRHSEAMKIEAEIDQATMEGRIVG